jgi:hypothetical protein
LYVVAPIASAAVEYVGIKASKMVVKAKTAQAKAEPKIPESRKKVEVCVDPKAKPMVGKQISFEEFLSGNMVG